MRKLSILAIRLYPLDFRAAFAEEMTATVESQPPRARELFAIVFGAAREWFDKITTDTTIRGRVLPDIRMMRPPGVSREDWFLRKHSPCSWDTSQPR